MTQTVFLEPLDVLILRGNKLFGDPGSYGESLVPPWPSVAAGALRSRVLADARIDLAAFARGEIEHPEIGTPDKPGSFAITAFHMARRNADGRIEALFTPPADVVISEDQGGQPSVRTLAPKAVRPNAADESKAIQSSAPFTDLPVLSETTRGKPASGYWLTEAGQRAYLAGKRPEPAHLVKSSELWRVDARVGVGLEAATRSAAEGRLFSLQAVAMRKGVGFLAAATGARLPQAGSVRLGGDGRAAALHAVEAHLPEPDYATIANDRRCRLLLATPGIFAAGWLPTGVTQTTDGEWRFELGGVKARLVCAAIPRHDTVSGWDLAQWQPKPAQRAAPAGSVYWLDQLEATPEALRKLVAHGLWSEPSEDAQRRAEGFNRIVLARWSEEIPI